VPILTVDFAGEVHVLAPGDEFTFGRGSKNDLDIDSNPQLHRRFGHLSYRDGSWWLRNNGSRLALELQDQASRSSATLTSGTEMSLTFQMATVAFEVGGTRYEVSLELAAPPQPEVSNSEGFDASDSLSAQTIDQSQVPLVGEQRMLAVALAENKLRDPHAPLQLPTNKAVAHRFGWSMTTFNRKLDRMCKKYARAGVSGLVGGPGGLASDRRTRLVEHLISTGAVSVVDLDLLEELP